MNHAISIDWIIAILTRSFAQLESRTLQESELADLSMKQLVYLDSIAKMDSPTSSDLARKLEVSKPSVTAIVSKLIQKGYVQKVQSNEDKRSHFLFLTKKGEELSQIHENIHHQIAQHFASALDATELNQLAFLLKKVVEKELQ